ncbi:MAG: cytochrome b5 [Sphingobacteriales bacterium]|nr:MAG: cytochrome b5 [Sphingobacteriales bacterium]
MEHLPEFSKFQLALRNGHDRDEIWVAYKGIIYDLTGSSLWRYGMHYEHFAGQDLTEEIERAPHTEWVFERFKQVGRLKIVST